MWAFLLKEYSTEYYLDVPVIELKKQGLEEVIDISQWAIDDEAFAVYPEGKRDKSLVTSPQNIFDFCIPEHFYLFKLSRPCYPAQYWMEIFAYQLGCLVGVTVPPAFVAYNSKTKESGVLIEWFYKPVEGFVLGGHIMRSNISNYEGRKHNLQTIIYALNNKPWMLKNGWFVDFAKMLTFDALIGNTDRHHNNWGIISRQTILSGRELKSREFEGRQYESREYESREYESRKYESRERIIYDYRLAPAFDNGTSMGHEISEEDFSKKIQCIANYVTRGKPHLRWNLAEDYKKRANHETLLKRLVQADPGLRKPMLSCLQFSKKQVEEILGSLTTFNVPCRLTEKRAHFMLYLIDYRQQRLLSILNNEVYA